MVGAKDKALKSIFKGGAIMLVGSLVSKFVSLLFRILVGRTGVAEYGQISVMMAVFSTAILFSQLGVPNGVQRYVAYYLGKDEEQKAIGSFQTGLKIITASSIVTGITLFASANWLATTVFHNPDLTVLIRLAAIAVPFRAYSAISMHLTNALEKMHYSVLNDKIITNALQLILAFALITLGYGYFGAAIAYSVTFVLGGFLGIYFAYREFPEVFTTRSRYTDYGEIFHHSWPLVLAGLFSKITGNIDTFMLQSFISSEKVGLYQAAFPFASALTMASGMFGAIFLSNASELISQGKNETLKKTYRTVVKWTSITMVPMFLIVFAFPRVVLTLFGAEYYAAENILRILSLGFIINGLVGPAGNIYQALEKTKLNFYTTAVVGISNLVLNFLLIPEYGVMGAAWASTASLTIAALINGAIVYRVTGRQPIRKSVVKVWVSGLIGITGVYLATNILFTYTPKWFFVVDLVLFGLLYSVIMLSLGTIEEEDLMIMKAIRDKTGLELEKTEKMIRKII